MIAHAVALMFVCCLTYPVVTSAHSLQRLPYSVAGDQEEIDEDSSEPPEVSGEYEAILDSRKDFALNKREKDDLLRLDQELQIRLSHRRNERLSLFVEAKLLSETELYAERRGRNSDEMLERGETWIRFDELFGYHLTLQVGRQNFEEPRRWWWDDDLDAVHMFYQGSRWSFELGLARELAPTSTLERFVDPEDEGVVRVFVRADRPLSQNHGLSLFSLYQNDASPTPPLETAVKASRVDPSDARLWWGGIRATGRTARGGYGELSYWADSAIVLGTEKLLEFDEEEGSRSRVVSRINRHVRGWAVDVGGRWAAPFLGHPIFTVGYALGSGDRHPKKGKDRAFRQTGLQSTDEQFRTYGELLRPELSNLSVATLALEFPILSGSRVEFSYRWFQQQHGAPFLRDARIEAEPTGRGRSVGQEWMMLLGTEEGEDIEVELASAGFRAGHAYGRLSGNMAYSLFMKVTYSF